MARHRQDRGARHGRARTHGGQGLSKGWTWALLAAVVAGFGAYVLEPVWAPVVRGPAPPPAERLAQGAALFRQHCATCHGDRAQGQQPAQPMGGTRTDGTFIAPALNGTAHAWHHPPRQLLNLVRNGSPAPQSPMKGWGDRLSEREIEAVLAYVQSLWPPALLARYRRMNAGQ